MENSSLVFLPFLIFILIIGLFVYIAFCVYLGKYSQLKIGKFSVLSWIPIANLYLLAYLTFNKILGIIFAVISLIIVRVNIAFGSFNLNICIMDLIPDSIRDIALRFIYPIYGLLFMTLFIFSIVNYIKLKNNNKNEIIEDIKDVNNNFNINMDNISIEIV